MSKRYRNYYVYSPRSKAAESGDKIKTSGFAKKPLLAVLLVLLGGGIYLFNAQHTAAKNAAEATRLADIAEGQRRKAIFNKSVHDILKENSHIGFSITAIDLSDNSTHNFGSSSAMDAASTAKLITASLFLHRVQSNQASLSMKLESESAKYELRQLIQKSDDKAWQLFNDYLGHPALAAYAQQISASSYSPESGRIKSEDMAIVLKKLYRGELLNENHTKLLLSYMQNTNYEDYISPAVPKDAKIYHKVGLTEDYVNDAAVITRNNKSFVLVIFTNGNGSYDYLERAEMMQQITKAATEAFL